VRESSAPTFAAVFFLMVLSWETVFINWFFRIRKKFRPLVVTLSGRF
jgi:hypothetical protein